MQLNELRKWVNSASRFGFRPDEIFHFHDFGKDFLR